MEDRRDEQISIRDDLLRTNREIAALGSEIATLQGQSRLRATEQRRLNAAQDELAGAQREQDQLRQQSAELERLARAAPQVAFELEALERREFQLREQANEIAERRLNASLGEQLDDEQNFERFRLLEPALPADYPSSRSRASIVVMGLAAGLFLGLMLSYAMDWLNPALRSAAQVERELGMQPALVIPKIELPAERRRRSIGWAAGWGACGADRAGTGHDAHERLRGGMGNAVAYLALLTWPLVILVMFKRMPVERAFIWSILGGYMALPQITQIGLPLLPDLDKVLIPNVTAFVVCLALVRERVAVVPQNLLARILLVLFILSPAFTVFTNTEPLLFGLVTSDHTTWMGIFSPANATIPGLRVYDSLSVVAAQIIFMLPFFLARSLLAHERALAELPRALVVAGLIYSLPIVVENAIGPELHRMVYGFIQHDYAQAIRFGGFRPYVFMPHGLWVAFFAMMCFASALLQARQADAAERTRAVMIAVWLGLMLVLCRSVGPWVLALVVAPLVLFFGPRMQLRVSALMALTALAYPLLRGSGHCACRCHGPFRGRYFRGSRRIAWLSVHE